MIKNKETYPVVGKHSLFYSIWSKMMGGNGISGTIRTFPENYYVATVHWNGAITFDDIEACTRGIDEQKVMQLWNEKKLPIDDNFSVQS